MVKTNILVTEISDILEIARLKKLEVFIATMDLEKAFDSLDHNFLISALEKLGFGKRPGVVCY